MQKNRSRGKLFSIKKLQKLPKACNFISTSYNIKIFNKQINYKLTLFIFSILLKNSADLKYYISLSVQFITQIIEELEVDNNAILKMNSENNLCSITNYHKRQILNKERKTCEQIKQDIQIMINRKNQIERYFETVDRQLQFEIKKKMFVIIIIKSTYII